MYLIIGLGNPEADYANTRHNMGFNVINKLSEKYDIEVKKDKFKALFGSGMIEGEKIVLIKPQTFMNLSGESIKECKDFYKIEEENLIVIYDDIDIEPGKIRIRKNGSSGSHNGMKSIVSCLSSEGFPRIRIGIGKPHEHMDMIAHVIGGIDEEDKEKLSKGVELGVEAVSELLKNNIDSAMNKYN